MSLAFSWQRVGERYPIYLEKQSESSIKTALHGSSTLPKFETMIHALISMGIHMITREVGLLAGTPGKSIGCEEYKVGVYMSELTCQFQVQELKASSSVFNDSE